MIGTSQGRDTTAPIPYTRDETMMSLTVDLSQFNAAISAFPVELGRVIRKQLKQEIMNVAREARKNHRFRRRSGKLQQSILEKLEPDGTVATAYLESGIAPYGVYVHEGHGTHDNPAPGNYVWDPDQFLYKALGQQEYDIKEHMTQAVAEAARNVGF